VRAIAGSSLGICPPLIITRTQVDELIDKLVLSLNQTLNHVEQHRLLVA
jgi:4-aminobutyrate--pyruvate transaminase